MRRLQIRDNRGEGANPVSDVWDHLNSRDSGASQLQDKEVVNLPPLVDQTLPLPFRRVVTAPGTLLISGARVGRKMHIAHMQWHISITLNTINNAQEADSFIATVIRHMEQNHPRWYFVKDDDPLQYSVKLNDFYEEVHRYCLTNLDYYMEWIKPRG